MFRVSQHSSSGVLKIVTAASGTGHSTGAATSLQRGMIGTGLCKSRLDLHKLAATSLQRGQIMPRWSEVAAPVLWPVPEAAVTVFSAPDDGCCDTRNM